MTASKAQAKHTLSYFHASSALCGMVACSSLLLRQHCAECSPVHRASLPPGCPLISTSLSTELFAVVVPLIASNVLSTRLAFPPGTIAEHLAVRALVPLIISSIALAVAGAGGLSGAVVRGADLGTDEVRSSPRWTVPAPSVVVKVCSHAVRRSMCVAMFRYRIHTQMRGQ